MKKTSNNLLLIFTRNPELGKCKTRLASTIGDQAALAIYKFLLQHTVSITENLFFDKQVLYSEEVLENDLWNSNIFEKKLQKGIDLGERMQNAFIDGFKAGYKNICIIGSDMFDLSQNDLENAFKQLEKHNFVIGPAADGGYYLLGMNLLNKKLFIDKAWGTGNVLKHTLVDLEGENYISLDTRNDVDLYEDIATIDAFQPFLKHLKK